MMGNINFPVADQILGISLIWSTRTLYLQHPQHRRVVDTRIDHATSPPVIDDRVLNFKWFFGGYFPNDNSDEITESDL